MAAPWTAPYEHPSAAAQAAKRHCHGRLVPGRLLPLYGLPPAWPGSRYLGGWEGGWAMGQRPVTTALSLGHGDPLTDQGSQLRVEVRVERVDAERVPTVLSESRRHLAEDLWLAAASQAPDAAERWERIVGARRRPDPTWSQVTIPVDGRLVDFEWLGEGRRWVARAEVDDRTLTLHGRDPPVESVELVRVSDLEPYIQGQRRLQEAWARTTTRSTSRTGPLAVLSGWHLATPANRREDPGTGRCVERSLACHSTSIDI
jgi:hypothetical protein